VALHNQGMLYQAIPSEAIAPTPTKKRQRSQNLSSSRCPSSKVVDDLETDAALKPEQLICNPASWRGWVDKPLGGDRYQVTFENGINDEYPRHLLRVQDGQQHGRLQM